MEREEYIDRLIENRIETLKTNISVANTELKVHRGYVDRYEKRLAMHQDELDKLVSDLEAKESSCERTKAS